jgi:D-alanine-D-alanine ligase
MNVALLHNVNRGQSEHETEFDLPITIDALTAALSKEHIVLPVECTRDFTRWLTQLTLFHPDIAFNVAEGYRGAAREALYPAICEQLDIPFTGPGPTELLVCHNKSLTKRILQTEDVRMAWGKLLSAAADLDQLRDTALPFPLIVKLNSEGSSLGMDEGCIVYSWPELQQQVEKVWGKFRCDILIEQYIEGTDLSATFVEGLGVYGPVEYTYPNRSIYDYWLKSENNHLVKVDVPLNLPAVKRREILEKTEVVAKALRLQGYGRADFRMDAVTQELYFLEMNAQVCFHPDGAFILSVTKNCDLSYDDVVLHIVRHALQTRGCVRNAL